MKLASTRAACDRIELIGLPFTDPSVTEASPIRQHDRADQWGATSAAQLTRPFQRR
jgi:hypothetical protein